MAVSTPRKKLTAFLLAVWLLVMGIFVEGCFLPALPNPGNPVARLSNSAGDLAYVSDPANESGESALYLLDIESKRALPILGTAHNLPSPFSWSPDGKFIAFEEIIVDGVSESDPRYGSLGTVLVDEKGQITVFKACCASPSWSPDGKLIACLDCCGQAERLYIAHPDSSGERTIVDDIHYRDGSILYFSRIAWSPDSQSIAFESRDATGQWSIWIVQLAGTAAEQVTEGRHPTWSLTGDEIAFSRDGRLFKINVDSGLETELVSLPVYAEWPAFSPDGKRLAFEGSQSKEESKSIYLVNLDGSGLVQVGDSDGGYDRFPAWRP